jgi:hypothetical protein
MKYLATAAVLVCAFALAVAAQPRPVERETKAAAASHSGPAPETFRAKYEGGLFGFSKKEEGTLKFDDANERLVFFGKEGKERFGIPYGALQAVSPESEWAGSTTGTVVKNAPVIGAGTLGSLLKEKRRYLVIEFFDHNEARVTTSFRVDDKELLGAVIQALGEKAELTAQGDAFYRQRR